MVVTFFILDFFFSFPFLHAPNNPLIVGAKWRGSFWVLGGRRRALGKKAGGGGARRPQSLRPRKCPPRDSADIFLSGADSWQRRLRPTAQARAAQAALLKNQGCFFPGQRSRGSPWAADPGGGRVPGFGSPLEPPRGLGRGRRSRGGVEPVCLSPRWRWASPERSLPL